ncbi:hypothetical protein PA3071 [hydrothermal vent metagenome]|uniref:DUF58 domain-containing protein n=1 Tax=hydrothermal vent metagenome TaxID=652676 RepID=A0A3B0ZAC0_9ZZZZ
MLKRLSQLFARGASQESLAGEARASSVSSAVIDTPFDPVRPDKKSLIGLHREAAGLSLNALKVRAAQSGQYLSSFRGRGMEFDEVRPYQAGDDVRTLDWRVMARTGKPHTKLFREERERAVLLWVDSRRSMFFATRGAFKSVVAARAAVLLGWAAVAQGDRIGGLIFSEQQHEELRPQGSKHAVLHLIQRMVKQEQLAWEQAKAATQHNSDVASDAAVQSLLRLRRVARPGSLVVLLSDFRDVEERSELHLAQLARHNDVVMFFIYDELESTLPPAGLYRVGDGEQAVTLDTTAAAARDAYHQRFIERRDALQALCRRHGICFIPCSTTQSMTQRLREGLGMRGVV